jgi:zinc transporter, ZIP family
MQDFRISESDAFLSASLSLSFGVMLFSSLYSMLPQSKQYLEDGGYSPRAASYMLIGLFLAGVVGIRVLSAVLHHFIPSHVVDCDHTHDQEAPKEEQEEMAEHSHDDEHTTGLRIVKPMPQPVADEDEETPLLSRTASLSPPKNRSSLVEQPASENGFVTAPSSRRPSLMPRSLTRTLTRYMSGRKSECDESGPCMGFSDPCGQDCFKAVKRRVSILPSQAFAFSRAPTWRNSSAEPRLPTALPKTQEHGEDEENQARAVSEPDRARTDSRNDGPKATTRARSATHHYHHPENEHLHPTDRSRRASAHSHSHSVGAEHHHHVPTNAFMSIGLQTSLAIALHKAPEGFITYATNHANPTLGFAVFMALFIHNITEGFAMSLPLYLALGSRIKAIIWSSILGGVSQPIGAGVAALWFKLAKSSYLGAPSEGVYGGMFAVTAGVMTSVALSLFSESLQLSHNRTTCIIFAFLGMSILGFSFALTAK